MESYLRSLSNKQESLLAAVQNQTFSDLNLSLDGFPDFTEDTAFSYLLLIAALHRGDNSISVLLIEKGCSVTSSLKTNYYNTPLYYAALTDNMKIFKMLYKHGASILDTDANKETPLELIMQHYPYFENFILLDRNYDEVDSKCEEDVAIFHMACYNGNLETIKKFVKRDFSINSRSDFRRKGLTGATPIQLALKAHNEHAVRFFLQLDVDFDVQDNQGNTILHSAIEKLDEDPSQPSDPLFDAIILAYVRRFDQTKFSNPTNEDGLSHFHILCSVEMESNDDSFKLLNILKYFIKKGVDLNSTNTSKRGENNQILYYAGYSALHFATRKSRLNILKLLLENGADPTKIDAAGNTQYWNQTFKNTPLHILDFENSDCIRIAELLLKYGASVDVQNSQGDTPLHHAFYVRDENEHLMQLLLAASRGIINHTNNRGLSYLQIACSADLNKVKNLVENAESVQDCMNSALSFAIHYNKVEIVEYVLAHGAKVDSVVSSGENSPLHLACIEQIMQLYNEPIAEDYENNRREVLPRRKSRADVDWSKSRENQIRIIELLLEHGAPINIRNSQGMTPLFAVCDFSRFMKVGSWMAFDTPENKEVLARQKIVADVLLRHGADINSRDSSGRSVLHILSSQSAKDGRELKLAKFLLERGADVDVVDNQNTTPFHSTIEGLIELDDDGEVLQEIDSSFIDLFLEHGANVNLRGDGNCAPLHTAVKYYHDHDVCDEAFVKLLNQTNIDLDAQDNVGNTPLHVAFSMRKLFCIEKLLNVGANVNVQNIYGQTPICYLEKSCEDPYYANSWAKKEMRETFIIHIKKLVKMNHFIDEKVEMYFRAMMELKGINPLTIDSKIDQEMKKLETIKVDKYTSLWQILIKHPNDSVKHTKNEALENIISSARIQKDFPLFFGLLERQFKKALLRSLILEPAKKALRIVTKTNWPDSCSEEILRHLSNENLELLQKSASIANVAERSQENLRKAGKSRSCKVLCVT